MLRNKLTETLLALQAKTCSRPYSIVHRLQLAEAYENLGYPDLALGDAYKALVLIDEIVEQGEYYEEALEAFGNDFRLENDSGLDVDIKQSLLEQTDMMVNLKRVNWSKTAYV